MGHHHVHPYLVQLQALFLAATIPALAILMLAAAWWEAHRRRHGRAVRPGSRRGVVSARFLPAAD
jgi:hypothetical protein